jgi:hypothetical protein
MGYPSTCPLHPPSFFHTKKILLFSFFFFFHFYDSLFFHEPDIFYKTSFQFFLSFWEHFKTWGGKLDVLKVLPTKAKEHRVGNRCRSDVTMVRCLRRHMAHLNVGPCPKASWWGLSCGSWVPHGAQASNLLCERYL